MYHVEILPGSTAHVTPGWTYVPDSGFGAPKAAAIPPTVGRKRGIREPGGRTDISARQHNAILRHLAELDRENHRDVQIPITVKQKEVVSRPSRAKTTTNVRRILQSQKTFKNYLDDEEAALAQAAQTANAAQRTATSKITKLVPARRSLTPVPAGLPRRDSTKQRTRLFASTSSSSSSSSQAGTPTPIPAHAESPTTSTPQSAGGGDDNIGPTTETLIQTEYDNDPLLRSYTPSAPSERIMQLLLSEPPLTYNAARGGPPTTQRPDRHFCCMCGYWGKIRCRNCHLRTCGMDCYKMHEDSRCGAFY